jgi:hypothetical protein
VLNFYFSGQPASGEVIGQLQPTEDFSALEGPECVNDMDGWQVDNGNGLVGWTAAAHIVG